MRDKISLTDSFVSVSSVLPSHQLIFGGGRDPRTSHLSSYVCFVDMNFKFCTILTDKGLTALFQ